MGKILSGSGREADSEHNDATNLVMLKREGSNPVTSASDPDVLCGWLPRSTCRFDDLVHSSGAVLCPASQDGSSVSNFCIRDSR